MRAPRIRFALFLTGLVAAGIGLALPAGPLLTVDAELQAAGPGQGTLHLAATLAPGWHVNSHRPSEDYLIPTTVRLDPVSGVQFGEPRYPEGVKKKFAFSETPLSVYDEHFAIDVPVSWTPGPVPALSGTVEYQACNDRQCNPPASAAFHVGAGAAALPGGALALSAGSAGTTAPGGELSQRLAREGYPLVLLSIFVIGLGLNLTPCVYPVIPLTIGFFGGQAPGNRSRVLLLASLYVLGIVVMYAALGVIAALTGKLFGAVLQSPLVLSGIALVLILLSLSMFGLYDIQMPAALLQKAGARTGIPGAFAMGLLVGVVAAPCVAPFTVGLLTFIAERQSVPLGTLLFGVLGLGLGAPYVALGAFSGSLSRLPRAGSWMDGVKKVFGLLLLAMAAYFFRLVLPKPLSTWLLPAVVAIAGILVAVHGFGLPRLLRGSAAVLFLAGALFFFPRKAEGWQPYNESEIQAAGRPRIVDFGADWCIPCLELEQRTFSDPRVRKELERRALFKADLTRGSSPEALALARKYSILGVPTVIFLDASGTERQDLRLVGFEGPDAFLKRLEKAP
ncbi:MAG TPA: cytochrome c biogenesis protein CcdA [Thermoanaerobaculia bacterium]|nr:cytochrome c biogenesis protein CcdA [Thermoanaerobaculia bacterium]